MLAIEAVKAHHRGNYSCFARNRAGLAQYSAFLSVNGKNGGLTVKLLNKWFFSSELCNLDVRRKFNFLQNVPKNLHLCI
jgi:hypothetical protein